MSIALPREQHRHIWVWDNTCYRPCLFLGRSSRDVTHGKASTISFLATDAKQYTENQMVLWKNTSISGARRTVQPADGFAFKDVEKYGVVEVKISDARRVSSPVQRHVWVWTGHGYMRCGFLEKEGSTAYNKQSRVLVELSDGRVGSWPENIKWKDPAAGKDHEDTTSGQAAGVELSPLPESPEQDR